MDYKIVFFLIAFYFSQAAEIIQSSSNQTFYETINEISEVKSLPPFQVIHYNETFYLPWD